MIGAPGTILAINLGMMEIKHREGPTMTLMTPRYGPTQPKARYPLAPRVGRFLSGRNSGLLPLLAALLLTISCSAEAGVVIRAESGLLVDVTAVVATFLHALHAAESDAE